MRSAPFPRLATLAAFGGLVALSAGLAAHHTPEDKETHHKVPDLAELTPGVNATGALLLDLVEPEEGEGGSDAELAALTTSLNAEPLEGVFGESEHIIRVTGDPEDLAKLEAALADHPLVEGIEPELIYTLPSMEGTSVDEVPFLPTKEEQDRFVPNDPMFDLQWHMEAIHTPEAWMTATGEGAIVAVVDTGVAYKDLAGKAKQVPDLACTHFMEGETFGYGLPDGLDGNAHGTHVAGTIAQCTDNGIGVAGVAYDSTILPVTVLSPRGSGTAEDIADGIRFAADQGAHVINMSLGSPYYSAIMDKATTYAHEKGVTVVCASGNEQMSRVGYPAANKHAVAVGATDALGKRSWFSNYGDDLDVSAPGGDTRQDHNGNGHPDGVLQNTIGRQNPMQNQYAWFQGTSMASPHAAGVAALIVSQGVTNPDEVERIMKETAVSPKGVKWEPEYGAGIIDAAAAAEMAATNYTPERSGFAGLLALLMLGLGAGAGFRSLSSKPLYEVGGLILGLALGAGLMSLPVAYGVASALGGGAWFGSPFVMSALIPVLAVAFLFNVRPLRGLLAGLSLGYAAVLLHGAVVLPTLISGLPGGPSIDRLWLLANACIAGWIAHRAFFRR